ncbi:hypothetical protein [Pseudidiomarina sp.]|uniref:hypothetical protein n=1 Tax=Pseudidiomarina sp. TaxID=2081707 RepID=UPI00299F370E|nr:hypothetical protein [Pseudidiomarina sp.]MDX1706310.1 hypothetical protein [Pseudidiomarina sp.]
MWPVKGALLALLLMEPAVAQQLSDPTEPPRIKQQGTKVATKATLRLESIQWTEDHRVARINGERLIEGDTYNNYKIQSIGMDHVTLLNIRTNEQLTLAMFANVRFVSESKGKGAR